MVGSFTNLKRDIEEFLKFNDCPGVYRTRGMFALWAYPVVNNNAIRGMVGRNEIVVLLDIIPGVIDAGHNKFVPLTKFFLLTSRGVGYITFDTYYGDGGILSRVKRVLDICY